MTTILHILQHALGRDEYGQRRDRSRADDYRNHYCAGDNDLSMCREAVAQGLMVEHAPREISGGCPIFTVTDKGKAHIAEHSPAPPKLSPGKARYLRWLHLRDVLDLSFGEWLKSESRRQA